MSTASSSDRTKPRWAVPYRPLRGTTLLIQLVFLVGVEIVLFASYSGHDARFHWATHFLVGLVAALVWMSAYLVIAGKPASGQLIVVLILHLFAMAPDLLFRIGFPHYPWMDVFLGHVSVHYLPGGDDSWLVLALIALAGYAWLLSRWLRAREVEAGAGLPPGIGIGGIAVIRPQRDPRANPLTHRHTPAAASSGKDGQVVLLHDIGQGAVNWQRLADDIAELGLATTSVDLLGHGGSRAIGTRFTLPDQAAALGVLFDGHGWEEVVLVGTGWGAAVAADFARRDPDRVSRLILLDPPVYTDAGEAARRLRSSRLGRATLTSPGLANFACGLMCLTRAPLGRLARVGRGGVCGAEAAAAVQHTYPSLRDGFDALVNANPLLSVLRDPVYPVTLVFGAGAAIPAGDLHALPISADVDVVTVSGTAELLGGHSAVVARVVAERSRH